MDIEKNNGGYSGLARQVKTVIDLNQPSIELLKTYRSKYGVTNFPESHVHDIFILDIDGELFYAKGEDVYLRTSSRYSLSYRNFLDFSISMFEFDESCVQERTFNFLDEPDVDNVTFRRDDILEHLEVIESITDDSDPGQIQEPKVREMFIFYLSRKERLVRKDGAVYDDVINHHGRDVIHEILASVLGQLFGIPVPRNYFGLKSAEHKLAWLDEASYPGPENHRYVLSKSVGEKHPTPFLVNVLDDKLKEISITWGLSLYREQSNPLNLQFFQNWETSGPHEMGNLVIKHCARFSDLILSDFLDRFLGGVRDRKTYDYLLPLGLQGPIYTVDFGEILFPELVFDPDDPHYLTEKMLWANRLRAYFRQVGELTSGNPYREHIEDLVNRVKRLDPGVLGELVHAIPEKFLLDHHDNSKYCYQKETIVDFLENQFRIIMEQNTLDKRPHQ